jgi:hypothetical protein
MRQSFTRSAESVAVVHPASSVEVRKCLPGHHEIRAQWIVQELGLMEITN